MNSKNIVMNVDYFDEVLVRKEPFGPADVDELVRRCADAGVNTLFWRATGLGVAAYPSQLVAPPEYLADLDVSALTARMARDAHLPFSANIGKWGLRMAESLKLMDPIAAARDSCRRYGVSFFIWFDYMDERHGRSLSQHPDWHVRGRDGTTTFPGLRSCAVAEAVADQLRTVDELVAYRPDGIYLCTSCHNRHLNFPQPDDFYGFEQPVMETYQREFGVDIRTQPLDQEAWHQIKGGFVTEFFRQVKQRLERIGARLAIGTQIGPHMILTSPVFSTHIPYRFATQWKRWVDEGIADILVLGDYEWLWDVHPMWQAKGIAPVQGRQPGDMVWRPYIEYIGDRVPCYYFSSWLDAYMAKHKGASADSLEGAMRMRAETIATTPVRGICLHEAAAFERHPSGFATVAAMRRRFATNGIAAN